MSLRPNLEIPTLGGKYLWSDIHLLGGWRIQRNFLTGHCRLIDQRDTRKAWGSFEHCRARLDQYQQELGLKFSSDHLYLLLHGLGRHKNSMARVTDHIKKLGLPAICLNYPSTFQSLDSHADDIEQLLNNLDGIKSVSFIGHSLGGLVARALLSENNSWRQKITARHLIMIGTPNEGARIADMMGGLKLFQAIAGPSGQDVRPFRVSQLPPPDIPTLVIAGGRGTKTGFNPIFGEDNDGIVTVAETKLAGMTDFKLVRVIHTVIMDHPDSLSAITDFIK